MDLRGLSFCYSDSPRSWRHCRRVRNKVLEAEPLEASGETARRMGRATLKYRLHVNHGFLNSPHTSMREKRIGREKYTRQSNVRFFFFRKITIFICLT